MPDGVSATAGSGESGSSGATGFTTGATVGTASPHGGGITGGGASGQATTGSSSAGWNRAPIKVGFLAYDFAKLVSTVDPDSEATDPLAPTRTMVKGLNARGGLAGRRIQPVYYTIDGSATDYSSQEQAACSHFTQDDRVEVLVGGETSGIVSQCTLKAGITLMGPSFSTGADQTEMRKYPNVFQVSGMTTNRQASALVEQGIQTGWLTAKNKLGVLISGCAWGGRVYDNVITPAAKRHGIHVEKFNMGCYNGSSAVGAYSSSVQSASLQFRGNGVDRVMFVMGGGDASGYLLFTNNAESQGWRPGYLVGTNAVARAWLEAGVLQVRQAENTHGSSWVPFLDVSNAPTTRQDHACLDIAKAGGAAATPTEGEAVNYYFVCDALLPLRLALTETRGIASLRALQPAVEALGTSYVAAGIVGGATRVGPSVHDGARDAAPFAYQAKCKCFQYIGPPRPAG